MPLTLSIGSTQTLWPRRAQPTLASVAVAASSASSSSCLPPSAPAGAWDVGTYARVEWEWCGMATRLPASPATSTATGTPSTSVGCPRSRPCWSRILSRRARSPPPRVNARRSPNV